MQNGGWEPQPNIASAFLGPHQGRRRGELVPRSGRTTRCALCRPATETSNLSHAISVPTCMASPIGVYKIRQNAQQNEPRTRFTPKTTPDTFGTLRPAGISQTFCKRLMSKTPLPPAHFHRNSGDPGPCRLGRGEREKDLVGVHGLFGLNQDAFDLPISE